MNISVCKALVDITCMKQWYLHRDIYKMSCWQRFPHAGEDNELLFDDNEGRIDTEHELQNIQRGFEYYVGNRAQAVI